ncbi:hypothetical protein ADUPG1_008958 [Aduncisulcus paluster]|uniref:Uncharacterized protein n=1 Tax=Aduncisulcus paluster TaxID=2918883 RepID=A0ABQ5KW44_9EUKA|nr:hypothetical protein ADUPG1_008958 [Aduncisulcus paluster]|eukprot:gnl/Carplike_NY0171/8951_a12450_143.p1 GENE.gnl/Carplike_NY0171/8951_a12450_143~~gnl/Carplike_NY0171/8951_a12450_143.p1  ORF type:complete len:355 (-),score=60.03 gnl/Carplike_NY0171/8951_a12450_143:89-1153(-)
MQLSELKSPKSPLSREMVQVSKSEVLSLLIISRKLKENYPNDRDVSKLYHSLSVISDSCHKSPSKVPKLSASDLKSPEVESGSLESPQLDGISTRTRRQSGIASAILVTPPAPVKGLSQPPVSCKPAGNNANNDNEGVARTPSQSKRVSVMIDSKVVASSTHDNGNAVEEVTPSVHSKYDKKHTKNDEVLDRGKMALLKAKRLLSQHGAKTPSSGLIVGKKSSISVRPGRPSSSMSYRRGNPKTPSQTHRSSGGTAGLGSAMPSRHVSTSMHSVSRQTPRSTKRVVVSSHQTPGGGKHKLTASFQRLSRRGATLSSCRTVSLGSRRTPVSLSRTPMMRGNEDFRKRNDPSDLKK